MPANLCIAFASFFPHLCPIVTWPTQRRSRELHWRVRHPTVPWDLSVPPGVGEGNSCSTRHVWFITAKMTLNPCVDRVQDVKKIAWRLKAMIFKSWMIEIQNISKQGLKKKGHLKQHFTANLWPPLPHLDFHGTQTRSHASAGASLVLCWHHLSHEFWTTFNPARWRDFRKHHPFDPFWAYHVYITIHIWNLG